VFRQNNDPNHADIAVRPGLLGGPFNEVVRISTFLPIKKAECAARPTRAPAVSDDVDVATRHEEIAGTSFNEARWHTKVLNLSRIGRGGDQHGIPTRFSRTMHIRQKHNSITHWYRHVVILRHCVRRL
jgi:hypothetical protein